MMKAKFYGFFLTLLGVSVLTSCEKEDDIHLSDVPSAVVNSFEAKFPNASRAEWEKKGGYIVADFWQDGMGPHGKEPQSFYLHQQGCLYSRIL